MAAVLPQYRHADGISKLLTATHGNVSGIQALLWSSVCTDRGESSREPTQRLPSWRQPVAAAHSTASLCTRLSNGVD